MLDITNPIFQDANKAREYLEAQRWPDGPVCPHCNAIDKATKLQGKSTRPGVYKCKACEQPFSVTVGTVFERSKIPLNKWLAATYLMTTSKKGISALQVQRMLGVTYKTAWFMCQRIREAMTPAPGSSEAGPIGGAGKTIEADETYVGGKTTTNSVEAFFSLLKRKVYGAHHAVSAHHLHRYVAEAEFMWNHRIALDVNDEGRANAALKGIGGKRLTYRPVG